MSESELNSIIQGCVAWDRNAQELLYKNFAKSIYKTCRLYADSDEEAADNLHDIFLHIFKKIDQFHGKGSFEGWLKRIAVNFCLQEIKKRKRFTALNEATIVDDGYYEEEPVENPQQSFQNILKEINKLPMKAGLVLKLYAIEGWTHAEIAAELGISLGTSKSQLNYARSILRAKCYVEGI
ncbi:MAG: hypothetical protein K0R65_297 [Crocinitomicaceae bacterium]|jgi:RNA polymerase sigma-70 factor (ECF subfamily)|nr:hypothetical protein [Crocinitomicaceae bacterium]